MTSTVKLAKPDLLTLALARIYWTALTNESFTTAYDFISIDWEMQSSVILSPSLVQ